MIKYQNEKGRLYKDPKRKVGTGYIFFNGFGHLSVELPVLGNSPGIIHMADYKIFRTLFTAKPTGEVGLAWV